MSLVELVVMGNKLSGLFPSVLTKISTLEVLNLASNEFMGKFPVGLFKLVKLNDLRLSDTRFTGQIPDMFNQSKNIQELRIEGTFLEGPIPTSISSLNLTHLRISDLKGNGGSIFPDLRRMRHIKELVLRSCMLHGSIPKYVGHMKYLNQLDLSFNNLTGKIPVSFSELEKLKHMYVTANKLTGPIPKWVHMKVNMNIDLSRNNFTWNESQHVECIPGNLNQVDSCLKQDFPCASKLFINKFYINCGGPSIFDEDSNHEYDQDLYEKGISMFYKGPSWAWSNTGDFDVNNIDSFAKKNSSVMITNNVSLYETARVSPLSLTYYGLCLYNGNYTVNLHFAEIIFTNDVNLFTSLGRRIFDVYIQGKLVLEDFNIAEQAGGAGVPIVKTFTANVTKNTLEIHFYWAGKGTQGIPFRGNYGPLISAISVYSDFKPPGNTTPTAIIVSSVIAVLAMIAVVVIYRAKFSKHRALPESPDSGATYRDYTMRQVKAATNNFHAGNKVGEGGFGSVYRGVLGGECIAIKTLMAGSRQGKKEFTTELSLMFTIKHDNLVRIKGGCVEGEHLMIVYEYMANNCLSDALSGKSNLNLEWGTRYNILIGIAKGLAFLHHGSSVPVIHRDIKPSNILLDEEMNAKISDFGLSKLIEDTRNKNSNTRLVGTPGYMAPEYAMYAILSPMADVYSFGIVAMEVLTGKKARECMISKEGTIEQQVRKSRRKGLPLEHIDPGLESDFSVVEAKLVADVSLSCTDKKPERRPSMREVVQILESRTGPEDNRRSLHPTPSHICATSRSLFEIEEEEETILLEK